MLAHLGTSAFFVSIFVCMHVSRKERMMRRPILKGFMKQHNLTVKDALPPFTDNPITVRQNITHEQPLLWWHVLAILSTINEL
jgi:hypothetical protein